MTPETLAFACGRRAWLRVLQAAVLAGAAFSCDNEQGVVAQPSGDQWEVQDVTPPTWPDAHGAVVDLGTHHVRIRWTPAEDDSGSVSYRLHGPRPTTVRGQELNVVGLEPGTSYVFRVEAVDTAGNVAVDSALIEARTTAECLVRVPSRGKTIQEATQ